MFRPTSDARIEDFKAEVSARIHSTLSAIAAKNYFPEQDERASGFAWVAREPQLMCGAKGAHILTEINRLPQPDWHAPA
jgi:hypothetical protein